MLKLVLTAPRSGGGKTTAACALLAALAARGQHPCAFKAGPDYIDPMFHRAVLGVKSHNLDLYFRHRTPCADCMRRGQLTVTPLSARGQWATMTGWAA